MALGLHYMHSNRILHRDLKTQNIFLLGNGRLVLGDLGISKVLEGTSDFAETLIGTPYYMSPEIFQNKVRGTASLHRTLARLCVTSSCPGCVCWSSPTTTSQTSGP